MNLTFKIAQLISTIFFIGKIKYAPGTWGSLIAFPFSYIIMHFILTQQIIFDISGFNQEEQQILSLFIMMLVITFLLFCIGTYAVAIYIKNNIQQDPKEVVIDEVVGQMLVCILSFLGVILLRNSQIAVYLSEEQVNFIFLFMIPFGLFRFFDITKPWPINWLDSNIKGALGVMIDDIAAAIFAVVSYYVLIFILIDFLPIL